jgi:hypothetical protein
MAGKDYGPKGCCQGTGAAVVLAVVVLPWAAIAEAYVKISLVVGWF